MDSEQREPCGADPEAFALPEAATREHLLQLTEALSPAMHHTCRPVIRRMTARITGPATDANARESCVNSMLLFLAMFVASTPERAALMEAVEGLKPPGYPTHDELREQRRAEAEEARARRTDPPTDEVLRAIAANMVSALGPEAFAPYITVARDVDGSDETRHDRANSSEDGDSVKEGNIDEQATGVAHRTRHDRADPSEVAATCEPNPGSAAGEDATT